tara:strand:+ start:2906 stop:3058 length:153 start_codon:yes stop_codon:yes gene_type:complete
MIADQSTGNLSFFYFFSELGQLGPRCQKRTIVHAVFRQQEQAGQSGPSAA